MPEYFGIFAVVENQLIKLDAQEVRVNKSVSVPLGQRSGVGNILQGQPVASSTNTQVPEFPRDLKIVVYSQAGGLQTSIDTAKSLHLERLVFVRDLTVNTGFPNNVRVKGAENGWESGDAPELLGVASGDRAKTLEFLIKPMQGHQDMVVAVLPERLAPGLYRIGVGQANPFSGSAGLVFAVSPVGDGEAASCVDAEVTYMFAMSNSKYSPCGGKPQAGRGSNSQGTTGDLVLRKVTANETSVIGAIRKINTAEVAYAVQHGDVGFTDLQPLGGAGLVDSVLASGVTQGYRFTVVAAGGMPATAYTVSADPLNAQTGGQHFFSDQTGIIRYSRAGPATASSPAL